MTCPAIQRSGSCCHKSSRRRWRPIRTSTFRLKKIVDYSGNQRDRSRAPLGQDVVFVLQNTQQTPDLQLPGLSIEAETVPVAKANFDIHFNVVETDTGLDITVTYCSDLFTEQTVRRIVSNYQCLLSSVTDRPQEAISSLDFLSSKEKEQLLVEFNRTYLDFPQDKSIIDVFAEQAQRHPNKLAVVHNNHTLTYQELDERSTALAKVLTARYALQIEDFVGVMMDRSSWAVISMLGILKAGGAYVPIDPGYPVDRKSFILEDSGLKVLLIESQHLFDVLEFEVNIFSVDIELDDQAVGANNTALASVRPNHLAYMIYTSGTTGRPKGVLVEHQSNVNMSLDQIKLFDVQASDRVLQFASLSFDASISELLMALYCGATSVIADKSTISDTSAFVQYLHAQEVTVATLPPTYLATLSFRRSPTPEGNHHRG